jgi:Alternative complex III, ActD subunit
MAYVVAEFKDDRALLAAARRLRALGHARLDAHSPYPLHGVDEALGLKRSKVPLIGLVGGVLGATGGYVMQWWMNAVDFPINVGNRLPHSPPTNIPITFESGVLIGALSIVIGMCALCGFPRTYHPVFELDAFRTATVDALWLSAEVAGDQVAPVIEELRNLGALQVSQVEEGR